MEMSAAVETLLRNNFISLANVTPRQLVVVVRGRINNPNGHLKVSMVGRFISYDSATHMLLLGVSQNSVRPAWMRPYLYDGWFLACGESYVAWCIRNPTDRP